MFVILSNKMSKQRVAVWETEAEVDEDLQDVDLNLAIGNYGQNGGYEDGMYLRHYTVFAYSKRPSPVQN